MEKQEKILHIYGQSFWHNPVLIVGTLSGLEKLYNVIGNAIKDPDAVKTSYDLFVNDGEGFIVAVALEDEKTIERLSVPYSDNAAREKKSGDGKSYLKYSEQKFKRHT